MKRKSRFIKRIMLMMLAALMILNMIPSASPAEISDECFSVSSEPIEGAEYNMVVFRVPGEEPGDYKTTESRIVETGTFVGALPAAADREGFLFIGWQTEKGEKVTEETIIQNNMIVTAIYDREAFYEDDFLTMVIHAPEDVLPANVKLDLKSVGLTELQQEAVMNTVSNSTAEILDAIDISILNSDGEKIQPNGSVHISMAMKKSVTGIFLLSTFPNLLQ